VEGQDRVIVGDWNFSRNGGTGIKENDGGDEFNYDIL
jgi:hypothetical protein